ncbi:MAG TPA: hypothetical protein VJB99_03720 [Patescibacteria group bacterium]|nr:hypothetical protein [Patescibacteria group bacterium]
MIDSKDILFIVLAFCALWFTAFVCWLIWQMATLLRRANETVSDARVKLGRLEEALGSMRSRFEQAVCGAGIVTEAAKRVVEYVSERRGRGHDATEEEGVHRGKKSPKGHA